MSSRVFTVEQFRRLLGRKGWKHVTHIQTEEKRQPYDPYGVIQEHDSTFGYVWVESTLGDLKIEYTQSFFYYDNQPSTFEYGDNGTELSLSYEGFMVVGEDGEELSDGDVQDIVEEFGAFTSYDDDGMYEDLDGRETVGTGSENEIIRRDYKPDLNVHYCGYVMHSSKDYDSKNWETIEFYGLQDGVVIGYEYHSIYVFNKPEYDGEVFTGPGASDRAAEWLRERIMDGKFAETAVKAMLKYFSEELSCKEK